MRHSRRLSVLRAVKMGALLLAAVAVVPPLVVGLGGQHGSAGTAGSGDVWALVRAGVASLGTLLLAWAMLRVAVRAARAPFADGLSPDPFVSAFDVVHPGARRPSTPPTFRDFASPDRSSVATRLR